MNPVLGIIGNLLGGSGNSGNNTMYNSNINTVSNAQANSARGGLNGILGLYSMLKGKSDPMQSLQAMAQNNPQIKQALDLITVVGVIIL